MIIGTEDYSEVGYLSNYKTSTFDVFKAGVGEAVDDNYFTKQLKLNEVDNFNIGAKLAKKDVELRAKEQGVLVNNIPEEGLSQRAADLLIDRQYQKKRRQEAISSAGGGFINGAAQFGGGLVGSMLDPLNVASSFIPVVGQARYAAWLGKAAGFGGRTAVRMGVGAAEGFVGAAIMEPFSYYTSQELGDDYDSTNSLMNLAFGTVMGGGMHMGAGAIGDAVARGSKFIEPNGKVARQLEAMGPETRMDMQKTAVAQMIEGRNVDVTPILEAKVNAQMAEVQKLSKIDEDVAQLKAEGKNAEAEVLQIKRDVEEQRIVEQFGGREDVVIQEPLSKDTGIKETFDSLEKKMPEDLEVSMYDGSLIRPETMTISNKEGYGNGRLEAQIYLDKNVNADNPKYAVDITDGYDWKTITRHFDTLQDAINYGQTKVRLPQMESMKSNSGSNSKGSSPTSPDSKFVDESIVEQHRQELESLPSDTRLEDIEAFTNEEVANVKEMAEQMGIKDADKIFEAEDAKIKSANEFGDLVRRMALCATRKS